MTRGKHGFWQAAVRGDDTHAQWRTFIFLMVVFLLPMVSYSHGLLIFLRHRAAAVFSHAQGLHIGLAHAGSKGKSRSIAWDFWVQEPFHAQGLCVSSLLIVAMHLFSSVCFGLVQIALTHRLFGAFFPCC